jgi:alcohol dehydrogenase
MNYVMKALAYRGPGMRSWEEVPDARIGEPADAVVRVDSVIICGKRFAHPWR